MNIGALIFPDMDQLDFTGPFEVLARLPETRFYLLWKNKKPIRDIHGLMLTPTTTLVRCPPLDILIIPGGAGQEALMEDEAVIFFIRQRAPRARIVLSVCTGALLCGAAGLLIGRPATTHWAALDLLALFGAIPSPKRFVSSGNLITCAGVTSGIDGALAAVAQISGKDRARRIQLAMEYAPEPPFHCGSISDAPAHVIASARRQFAPMIAKRLKTARRIAKKLGVK
jgi:cyclohexyl-isocyanide hydratase